MRMSNFIWSQTVGTMIPRGFTTRAVLIKKDGSEPYKVCAEYHWTWCESDAVYYRDDVDDLILFEAPRNGAKGFTFKRDYRKRTLVKIG